MRNVTHAAVLTALSTLLGLVPLAVNAQAPNQVIICLSLGGRVTPQTNFSFKLNGKSEAITGNECRTFSGASTFVFYTEYGRQPRYILERQLMGGGRYNISADKSGLYHLDAVELRRT